VDRSKETAPLGTAQRRDDERKRLGAGRPHATSAAVTRERLPHNLPVLDDLLDGGPVGGRVAGVITRRAAAPPARLKLSGRAASAGCWDPVALCPDHMSRASRVAR